MIYPYRCKKCGTKTEIWKSSDHSSDAEPCPLCETAMKRIYTAPLRPIIAGSQDRQYNLAKANGLSPTSSTDYSEVKNKTHAYSLSKKDEQEIAARLDRSEDRAIYNNAD
jgi:putative FmdB family regulatory protein